MEPLERYASHARLGRQEFLARHPHAFFLRRPGVRKASPAPSPTAIPYETGVALTAELVDEVLGAGYSVAEVKKKPSNPFPERISIGRAPNCDVVLRVPFVSKLHAQVVVRDDGGLELTDQGSANGTEVNGRELSAGESVPLGIGDRMTFGVLTVELVDAAAVFDLLVQEGLDK